MGQEQILHQSILKLSSLIPTTHTIRVFSAKWQTIRSKLEELLANLAAIDNSQPTENFSLSITLESISITLTECESLANRCSSSFNGGKLQTQSDLDVLTAKFDAHTRRISDIYSLGLLTQNYAIVVSRPSVSASKEDIRFYIGDLISRMKIGSAEMKKQAIGVLNGLIEEDDRYVKVAVEMDSLVSCLVKFLDSQEVEIQEESAKTVSLMAGFLSCKGVLVGAGVIAPLIRCLESGSELGKEYAARCLMKVTENADNAWSISAHGGVTVLLKICGGEGGNVGELVGLACGVLKNLVGVEEIKRFVIEEGAISELVRLVRSRDEVVQMSSVELLQTMAYGSGSVREMIIQEGGVGALVRNLDPKLPYSTKSREVAFRGVVNLCSFTGNSLSSLISYGFMDHVLHFLHYGDVSVQELALKASFWLCGTSDEAKKLMGDAGFMPVLVRFLDSKSFEVREMAAETLSSMVIVSKNRKRFIQNDQNVGLLLQMLDPTKVNSGNKKLLLSILMSLTSSNSARKKIVNSGYLKNIEQLAEAEGSEAQKIVRKLNSNRFRSIFTGLWNS